MTEEINAILSYFNLSRHEIDIYLAALKIGRGTVYQLAEMANLKRSTTYVIVDNLLAKGLLTTVRDRHRLLYLPVAPRKLYEMWRGKVEALETVVPDLNVYYRQSNYQPRVQVFEGEQAVADVYNELFPQDLREGEILLFASVSAVHDGFPHLVPPWKKIIKNKRNKIREIVNKEPGASEYAQQMIGLGNPSYKVRIMPDQSLGKTDTIIFRDKIAIFSLHQELFATVIESAEIAKSFRALFELSWLSAQEIEV